MSLKTVLIVGGTKDTGAAIAKSFDDERVVITVARSGALFPYDLTQQEQLNECIGKVVEQFGNPNVIVHVIGGSTGIKDALSSADDYAKVWRLNLGIALDINRAFIPAMVSKGWGRIVHLSSNATKLAIGYCPYASAKAAIEGYVRNVGKEYGSKGVVITAVRPGPIFTEGRYLYSQSPEWTKQYQENYVPMKRWGKGEELAGFVKFLCSDQAAYMGGGVYDFDGSMR
jgi:3-oxoacyl-[acyl-carrier protein] reductase